VLALSLLLLAGATGCPAFRPAPTVSSERVELVLPRATNEATTAYIKLARTAFPKAELYPALSRLGGAGSRPVLVVIQPAQLDPIQWPALRQSLEAGTPVLFWGHHPWATLDEADRAAAGWRPVRDLFESAASRIRWLDNREVTPWTAAVQSPFPRSLHEGISDAGSLRWVPLVETEDQDGTARAWPVSLWVEAHPSAPARCWGWMGVEAAGVPRKTVVDLLRLTVQRLQAGCFILPTEVAPVVYEGGHRLEVSIRVASPPARLANLRVAAELIEDGGRSVRRVTAPAQDMVTLSLGLLPRLSARYRDYSLRVKLESVEDRVLDQMEREFRVLANEPPPMADRMAVMGSGFTWGRRPFFVLGAELGPPPAALDPEVFEPAAVRRELQRALSAGINVVQVNLEHAGQIPALRWLMAEMRPMALRVYLRVAGLDPLDLDLARGRALLEAARVVEDPQVFALEVGARSTLGLAEERRVWDAAWRDWLIEQYGSVDHAENVWGQTVWRHQAQPTGPPDEVLAAAGPGSPALAAYRRFVDDLISRRTGEIRRLLDEMGWRALVGVRRSWGGPPERFPLDAASGVVHADFVSLEVAGLLADEAGRARAAYVTSYARGVGAGKPVLWCSVGAEAGALDQQAEQMETLLNLALRSHAAGVAVPPLAGGWSRPDFGLTFPDGRWRPAGDQMRRFNLRVRREVTPPPSWKDAVVERDAEARGFYGWLVTREPASQPDEVRPPGWNQSSLDMNLTALGGTAHQEPGPWSALNAEWGVVRTASQRVARVTGQPVPAPARVAMEVEVWNTGAARWVNAGAREPGAIWVRVSRRGGREQWLPVAETPPGQRAVVKWIPTDPGRWTWRMWNWERGGFGEPLAVEAR
jgi:hypothetical protein